MSRLLSGVTLLFVLPLCVSIVRAEQPGGPEVAVEGSDVLRHLKASAESIRNIHFSAVWEELEAGQRGYEVQVVDADDLSRIRVQIIDRGVYDSDGGRISAKTNSHFDLLYDGEKTTTTFFYPDYDAMGRPPTDPKWTGAAGYKSTRIVNGTTRGGPQEYRTPLTLLRGLLIHYLQDAIASGAEHEVTASSDGTLCNVSCRRAGQLLKAVLNVRKEWTPAKIEIQPENGAYTQMYEAEYERFGGDVWLPKKGFMRSTKGRGPNGAVLKEWSFSVSEASVNNPHFDDSVFALALSSNTGVVDDRFKVRYITDAEKVFDKDLERLAGKAREALPRNPSQEVPRSPFKWYLYACVPFLLLLVYVRLRRRSAGKPTVT